jgi:hypothetical protein
LKLVGRLWIGSIMDEGLPFISLWSVSYILCK